LKLSQIFDDAAIRQILTHQFANSGLLTSVSAFRRKGLGYSKDLETHKHALALHIGVYNFVRQHITRLK
jgi:hypothetical protein